MEVKNQDKYQAWLAISTTRGWKVFAEELEQKINWYGWEITHNENLSAEMLKNMQLILKGLRMAQSIPKQLENKSKTRMN